VANSTTQETLKWTLNSVRVRVVLLGNRRTQKFIGGNWILQFIDTFCEKTIETIANPS
jgi:hypothetical protein